MPYRPGRRVAIVHRLAERHGCGQVSSTLDSARLTRRVETRDVRNVLELLAESKEC
jgi:hypothetical protein